jgi:hypothetical protein
MKSNPFFTKAQAESIIDLIKKKLKADASAQKSIRSKIRKLGFYSSDFGFRDGYTVEQFLSVAKIVGGSAAIPKIQIKTETLGIESGKPKPSAQRSTSDEAYVIDLCDELLKQKALRQHRFDFLKGDSGTRLPVDAYYPSLNLVVEFKERQHTEEVKFFDKRQTGSGVGRGEQRKLYDQKRRDILPKHNIKLVELDYSEFEHTKAKKLLRYKEFDLKVIKEKLMR